MGNLFARALSTLLDSKRDVRVLMLGLDAAGKTTVLYKLKLGEVISTIPTIGFNVESVEYRNVHFQVWDIGGQDKLRPLWRHYYEGSDALIFVVDSSDTERLTEAKRTLHALLAQPELARAKLLVLANKQDVPHARTVAELSKELELTSLRGRPWYMQSTCACTGDGIYEGLDWLSRILSATQA